MNRYTFPVVLCTSTICGAVFGFILFFIFSLGHLDYCIQAAVIGAGIGMFIGWVREVYGILVALVRDFIKLVKTVCHMFEIVYRFIPPGPISLVLVTCFFCVWAILYVHYFTDGKSHAYIGYRNASSHGSFWIWAQPLTAGVTT